MGKVIILNRMLKPIDEKMRSWAIDKIIFKVALRVVLRQKLTRNMFL